MHEQAPTGMEISLSETGACRASLSTPRLEITHCAKCAGAAQMGFRLPFAAGGSQTGPNWRNILSAVAVLTLATTGSKWQGS